MTNRTDVPPAEPQSPARPSRLQEVALLINAAGAVLVVTLAVIAVFLICLILVGQVDSSDRAAVLTSAFTVLGTIVGTYTGIKIGSSGREDAERARVVESAKVEALSAQVGESGWGKAMDEVPTRLSQWGVSGSSGWGEGSGWAG